MHILSRHSVSKTILDLTHQLNIPWWQTAISGTTTYLQTSAILNTTSTATRTVVLTFYKWTVGSFNQSHPLARYPSGRTRMDNRLITWVPSRMFAISKRKRVKEVIRHSKRNPRFHSHTLYTSSVSEHSPAKGSSLWGEVFTFTYNCHQRFFGKCLYPPP